MALARAAAALLVGVTAAGCSSPPDGQSPSSPDPSASGPATAQCAAVDVPSLEIPPHGDGEPKMSIPAPPGWERSTALDSELIRFALVNQSLAAGGFAPNVTVTLEQIAGEQSADAVFEQQRTALVDQGGATNLKSTPGTLCGQPAETIDYTGAPVGAAPARPITVLLSALPAGDRTFAVTVTVQTVDAQNPTYRQDSATILNGFQFLPPDAG
jgi:hypothetical protein